MKEQNKIFLWIIGFCLLSAIEISKAQITWSAWYATPLTFGWEYGAYGSAGTQFMYIAGGNSTLTASNALWKFRLSAPSDFYSAMDVAVIGGCSVFDPSTKNTFFFGGILNNGSINTHVEVWSGIGEDLGYTIQAYVTSVPSSIVVGEDVRCALDTNRTVHFFGGKQNTTLHATYYIPGDSWGVLSGMPEGKYLHGAAWLGGLIYVFGGVNDAGLVTDSVFAYNISNQSWFVKPSLPQVNAGFASAVVNSRVYVVGGSDDANKEALGAYDSVWYYDSESANWTVTTSFVTSIKGLAAAISGNILYTAGGRFGNGTLTGARWKGTISGLPSPTPSPIPSPTPSPSPSTSPFPSPSSSSTPPGLSPLPSASVSPSITPSPLQNSSNKKKASSTSAVVGGVVGGLVFLALCSGGTVFLIKRRRNQPKEDSNPEGRASAELTSYATIPAKTGTSYDEIRLEVVAQSSSENEPIKNSWDMNYADIKIIKKLGSGAFGEVWEGKWKGSRVAVKKLSTTGKAKPADFFTEAELMKKLKPHPNVVALMGVCSDPPCLVTEFVANGDLFSLLQKGPIPDSMKLSVIQGTAAGMFYLHQQGVIHRDLAARNILLDGLNNPKVSDFGMSRVVVEDSGSQTSANVGPVRWMAPEALIQRLYNAKTDVWSFGIIIYEVLTCKLPYAKLDLTQVASQVAMNMVSLIPEIEQNKNQYPSQLVEVLTRCLQTRPDDRPDFSQIVDILDC